MGDCDETESIWFAVLLSHLAPHQARKLLPIERKKSVCQGRCVNGGASVRGMRKGSVGSARAAQR